MCDGTGGIVKLKGACLTIRTTIDILRIHTGPTVGFKQVVCIENFNRNGVAPITFFHIPITLRNIHVPVIFYEERIGYRTVIAYFWRI